MKQVVFLVALLGAFGEVCAAAAPPYVDGSTYLEQQARLSNSSHGQPQPTFISTAPKADNLDPVYDAFRKETSPSFVPLNSELSLTSCFTAVLNSLLSLNSPNLVPSDIVVLLLKTQ